MDNAELLAVLAELFGERPWPAPLHLVQAAERVESGEPVEAVARGIGSTPAHLRKVLQAKDRVKEVLGTSLPEIEEGRVQRSRLTLGQLLLGRAAEAAFEEIYRSEMPDQEFQLRDLRESRTDTDYRLLNGQGRPVYRVNIKFHGARFQRASELVGLEPEDCFALATYKIFSALQEQDVEGLPYIFAIVGVPHLSGGVVGRHLPERLVASTTLIHQAPRGKGKRNFEDRVIDHIAEQQLPVFHETRARIASADWYVLSARRADRLLRELLFDRVYAVRVPRFAQGFRRAELDMHFSLSKDLTPLRTFLSTLREGGWTKITTLLERGEF